MAKTVCLNGILGSDSRVVFIILFRNYLIDE